MRVRVGAVNYLNSKPLIEGLEQFAPGVDLVLDLPSRLADRMAANELDIGLIPVVEFFRARDYTFLPDLSIATLGPVLSVTLFSRVPWGTIRTVALDEGSRTSAALTQIMLRERHNVIPQVETLPIDVPADDISTDAVLLIGDRAMRACLPGFDYAYDLGEEWTRWTGLPMVFAVWAVRPGVDLAPQALAGFSATRDHGLANAGKIAAREAPGLGLDAGFCRRYLSNIIHYSLGPRELAGLKHYYSLAAELGLAPRGVDLVEYHHRSDFAQSH